MRIAIVNDTPMAVEALKRVVLSASEHEIAWIAEDGKQAVEQARADVPDLILMDLIMPVMDGVEATRQIMQHSPCVILVVTADVSTHSWKVFDAMGAGAMDAVNTPVMASNNETGGADDLLKKIYTLGKLISPQQQRTTVSRHELTQPEQNNEQLIVMGASTGGPNALASILAALPRDFPVPIIVVQHVDKQFVQGFVDWLSEQINLPVKLALEGQRLIPGTVLVADSGKHIQLTKSGCLRYQEEPKHYPHKPSINVVFESVATNWTGQAMGILLTGMGKDGAAGLLAMRDRGFCTIAQDQETCAVYGMPKTAVELEAADVVLPLHEIGALLYKRYLERQTAQAANNE